MDSRIGHIIRFDLRRSFEELIQFSEHLGVILRKQKGFRDEITLVAPGGMEAVGISFWDSREQADAYNSGGYERLLIKRYR